MSFRKVLKMNQENTNVAIVEPEINSCSHHWVIGAPEGPVSIGVCKICGVDKEFNNFVEGSSWASSDVSLDQLGKSMGATRDVNYGAAASALKTEDEFDTR